MADKTETIELEDYLTEVIEFDCDHFLTSFYEEWHEAAEEIGINLFAMLNSSTKVEIDYDSFEGIIAKILDKHEVRLIRRLRLFFDSLFKMLMDEEKKPFWEISRKWLGDYQKIIKKLQDREEGRFVPYGLEHLNLKMCVPVSWYLETAEKAIQRLKFEYEVI